jgi:hypothetical protein
MLVSDTAVLLSQLLLCCFRPDKLLIFPAKDKITIPEETMALSSEDEDEIEMNGPASQLTATPGFLAHHPRPLAVSIFNHYLSSLLRS